MDIATASTHSDIPEPPSRVDGCAHLAPGVHVRVQLWSKLARSEQKPAHSCPSCSAESVLAAKKAGGDPVTANKPIRQAVLSKRSSEKDRHMS